MVPAGGLSDRAPPCASGRTIFRQWRRHFAGRAAARFGLHEVLPDEEDIRLLQAYPWPGNVRELGAVIDRAAILGNGHRLEVEKALGIAADFPAGQHGAAGRLGDGRSSTGRRSVRLAR